MHTPLNFWFICFFFPDDCQVVIMLLLRLFNYQKLCSVVQRVYLTLIALFMKIFKVKHGNISRQDIWMRRIPIGSCLYQQNIWIQVPSLKMCIVNTIGEWCVILLISVKKIILCCLDIMADTYTHTYIGINWSMVNQSADPLLSFYGGTGSDEMC